MIPPKNTYKVGGVLWKKFTNEQKVMYNAVMAMSPLSSREFMQHPTEPSLTKDAYQTIRHNFACLAAFAIKDMLK